ncbi:thermonuclease family protein [Paludisphaera soli]|uniref:thermonuclease family protein n=1 Tax=Paludisphaera soli TaxID=2712865 RepID=UPI0013EBC86B|nr:thermonuclease family protein [Paludisphaera soli]
MPRAAVLLAALFAASAAPADEMPPEVFCARVVDGDTIVCEGDDGKRFVVRLLGVDAPETVHPRKEVQPFGPEASAYLKGRLVGRDVRLVADTVSRPSDRYGRRLAWVFLGAACVNEDLVRDGYGRAYLDYKFDTVMRVKMQLLERAAREERRGLWGLDEP